MIRFRARGSLAAEKAISESLSSGNRARGFLGPCLLRGAVRVFEIWSVPTFVALVSGMEDQEIEINL